MIKTFIITFLFSATVFADSNLIMTKVSPIKAKDFTLQSPSGASISLSDYEGKYVLVNFWAHWCSPCIKEFPDMQKLYEQSDKSQFEIIAIHAGPFNAEAEKFVDHFKISFPVVSDPETNLKGWDVRALPMTYLVDPSGNIIYEAIGPREWKQDDMQNLITN